MGSFSKVYEHSLSTDGSVFVWDLGTVAPFTEAIVSWNGLRPAVGKWTIYVSLRQNGWSPYLKYAEWTPAAQKTFKSLEDSFAQVYQDAAQPKSGHCDGLRVQVVAEEGTSLCSLHTLFACLSHHSSFAIQQPPKLARVLLSNVPRQSQFTLPHPRNKDLCSPTSTTTAIRYLLRKPLDPVSFAARSHDDGFDIYGNWILNTAEAYEHLHETHRVYVARLNNFSQLHAHLLKRHPVVVSIRGSLPDAPRIYTSGHLICVIGYSSGRVHCIDSSAPNNDSTYVTYDLHDFLAAWSLRRNIAYIFEKKET